MGSGPSLRFDDPHELRAWVCAAASDLCARTLPRGWAGDVEDALTTGAEAHEPGWSFHLPHDGAATTSARRTREPARWTTAALRLDAAAPFGGFLVPASGGLRLLAALDRREGREEIP